MIVERLIILQELEKVMPGLSSKDIIEQSSCFLFSGGSVHTFNDEIYCQQKTTLGKLLDGIAVPAEPLVNILRKIPDESIEIKLTKTQITFKGKSKRGGIRIQTEVTSPYESVGKAKKWIECHHDVPKAFGFVKACASTSQDQFHLTCVHVTSEHIEACDNYQISRYTLATGVKESFLLRAASASHIAPLDMTSICLSAGWVHFRNESNLQISCRRYPDNEYPNLDDIFKVKGKKITLSKALTNAVDRVSLFAKDVEDTVLITVHLHENKMKLRGESIVGWFAETTRIKYSGPEVQFKIPPEQLIQIANNYEQCIVSSNRLKIKGSNRVYVTCLEEIKKDEE